MGGVERNVSQRTYSLTVGDAGAIPLILPADDASAADADQLLDLLDGLVLAGGADIDPATYGAERDPATIGSAPSATDSSSPSPAGPSSATCRCSASAAARRC